MAIYDDENNEIWNGKQYLGDNKTNNVAEYSGLVTGLECATRLGIKNICVRGDSDLVVKQLTGVYQCKAPHLKELLQKALDLKQKFTKFDILRVQRDQNKRADELANTAMDERITDLGVAKNNVAYCTQNLSLSQDTTMTDATSVGQSTSLQGNGSFDNEDVDNEMSFIELPPSAQKSLAVTINCAKVQVDGINLEQSHAFDDALVDEQLGSLEIPSSAQKQGTCSDDSWLSDLSFLARFEIERFNLLNNQRLKGAALSADNLGELIDAIYKEVKSPDFKNASIPPYGHFLEHCLSSGFKVDEGNSCLFLFQARLTQNGVEYLTPEPADVLTKRIHRRFGSHRFLDLSLEKKCTGEELSGYMRRFFTADNKLVLAGRHYAILHSNLSEIPVTFRLFAESGTGIASSDEMDVSQVASHCIPPSLNPGLSVTKYMKRLQLSFTTTIPSLVLARDEIRMIPDIKSNNECIMTDGCGLISREALNKVWADYSCSIEARKRSLGRDSQETKGSCPHSSFQARIGGIKGMFVADDSLEGIMVEYRPSQLKYNTPLTTGENKVDSMYNTIEVMEWDKTKPPHAHLSTGFIQLLEERGVNQEFFLSLAQKEVDELSAVSTDYDLLTRRYKTRRQLSDSQCTLEDDVLWRMLCARVPLDEPTMLYKVNRFVNDELAAFKEKSRFPVPESRYVRIFPDHTGLLDSDEAFVAVGDPSAHGEIQRLSKIVAARNPSYFASDIRKLKVVSKADLLLRDPSKGSFFASIEAGLVLSTKGKKSVAEMMSGGDYDGDKAWCCWNQEIVNGVNDCQEHARSTGSIVDPWKDTLIRLNNHNFTDQIVSYTMHHRHDKCILGKIANTLEVIMDNTRFGIEDKISVARKAFVQVDNPYDSQWTPDDDALYGQMKIGRPHWKVGKEKSPRNTYRSVKVLGKLYDLLSDVRGKDFDYNAIEPEMNFYIRRRIEAAVKRDPDKVKDMRECVLKHLTDFNQTLTVIYDQYEDDDAITKRLKGKAVTDLCMMHRDEIHMAYQETDILDVMAILYEQTYFKQRDKMARKGGPYIFAWEVGQAYLTRIIADGSAPGGIAVTVARGCDRAIFGK